MLKRENSFEVKGTTSLTINPFEEAQTNQQGNLNLALSGFKVQGFQLLSLNLK